MNINEENILGENLTTFIKSALYIGIALGLYHIKNIEQQNLLLSFVIFMEVIIGGLTTWGLISAIANFRVGKTAKGIKDEFKKDLNNAFGLNGKPNSNDSSRGPSSND